MDIILTNNEFKAHVNNQTHVKQYDAISHPFHRLNSGSTQPSLKLGQKYVITFNKKYMIIRQHVRFSDHQCD